MLSATSPTAFAIIYAFWFVAGAYVYIALVRQINTARSTVSDTVATATFGLPEAILAACLICWFALIALASVGHGSDELSARSIIASFIITAGIVGFIIALLVLRRRNVETLSGLTKIGALRAVATGAILLFFAYPLVSLADIIVQQLFGSGSSRQSIVELFNSSQTLQQRIVIIIFAVAIAPAAEEFIFRFFLYGVLKRYFGFLFGLLANALLFAAVHGHLPSFAALFTLAACFTIAYEWSGSILVSMTMHALFNAGTLVVLAFPQILQR
jgi:uncharacterized protein